LITLLFTIEIHFTHLALARAQPSGYTFAQFQTYIPKEANLQGNDYDLTETHVSIYHGYVNFVKWGTISIIALLVLMAIFLL
jgi:hypothetical protein